MVIGSGPIVIGQAAEFDYAGTQACRSLREEGVEVCLVNSNPATIMTDKDIADEVYIEPLTVPVLEKIIEKEKPDSLLPTLGGQAGLNLGMELAESGFLDAHGVKLLGTTALTIKKAEDREMFKETMEKIGEPVAASEVVENVEDGVKFAEKIGYPVVLRPAYTLGGSGGGIAHSVQELRKILENGLRLSRVGQVLTASLSATWKTLIRSACTPAIRLSSHLHRRSPTRNIRCCVLRRSTSSTSCRSRAAVTCSSRFIRQALNTVLLR